jgi:acyl carrier protein
MRTLTTIDRSPIQEQFEQDIKILLSEKLRVDVGQIATEMTLGELGFDSLALSDLAEAIEEKFEVQVPNRTVPDTVTVGQLAVLLRNFKEGTKDRHEIVESAD